MRGREEEVGFEVITIHYVYVLENQKTNVTNENENTVFNGFC